MAKMMLRLLKMAKPYWGLLLISTAALVVASLAGLVTPEVVRALTRELTAAANGIDVSSSVLTRMILILSFPVILLCFLWKCPGGDKRFFHKFV